MTDKFEGRPEGGSDVPGRPGMSARFWAKVNKDGPVVRPELGACWLWTASCDNHGYGQFAMKTDNGYRPIKASRVAFFLMHGHWPVEASHDCDNPPCVRHIVNRTHAENQADMAAKGRTANNVCKNGRNPATAFHRAKTHCPQGHPYEEPNIIWRSPNRRRVCRICFNAAKRAWRRKTGKR